MPSSTSEPFALEAMGPFSSMIHVLKMRLVQLANYFVITGVLTNSQ